MKKTILILINCLVINQVMNQEVLAKSDGNQATSTPKASSAPATASNGVAVPDAKVIQPTAEKPQATQASQGDLALKKEKVPPPLETVPAATDDLIFGEEDEDSLPLPTQSNKPLTVVRSERVEILSRGTKVLNLPQPAAQVLVTDPKIADVQLATPNTLYVYGRLPGVTEVMVTGNDLESAYRYDVVVRPDLSELQRVLHMMAPNDNIKAFPLPDGVMLQGIVDSPKMAEELREIAQRYVGQSGNVLNRIQAKNAIQVQLRVKIAEVKRTILNQLNINWGAQSYNNNFRFGVLAGRAPTSAPVASPFAGAPQDNLGPFVRNPGNSLSSIGARFTDRINDFTSLIDALSQEGLATVLAEPNLVTVSGEEASFLAGGEYPYPVSQGVGASATITIQFKPYGISLSFLPTIIGDNIILRVKPEVSSIDTSLNVSDGTGNAIPALTTRRAEATLQMTNGESMVMAGLLSSSDTSSISALPGLADIPILGALFRSVDFQSSKTELIIVVTPYVVKPVDSAKDIIAPTDGLKYARLFDQALNRRINEPTPAAEQGKKPVLVGDAGFNF